MPQAPLPAVAGPPQPPANQDLPAPAIQGHLVAERPDASGAPAAGRSGTAGRSGIAGRLRAAGRSRVARRSRAAGWVGPLLGTIAVLALIDEGTVHLGAVVHPDFAAKAKAGDLVREALAVAGGKGGGRPEMARGAAPGGETEAEAILAKARELVG